MASEAVQIATALKTDLDAQSWPVTLTSYREYLGHISREDLGTANRVSIFPYSHNLGAISRGSVEREHGVAIVLRSSAAPEVASGVDELVETVEDLSDRYRLQKINYTEDSIATPTAVAQLLGDQLYDVDRLADSRTFLGGLIITYTTRS